MAIHKNALLHHKAFINGNWTPALSGRTFAIFNPANSEIIAEIADVGVEETKLAITAAEQAFQSWKNIPAKERAGLLIKWAGVITAKTEELAHLLTLEQGKTLVEARGEVNSGVQNLIWSAEECKRTYGNTIPTHRADLRFSTIKQPLGVIGVITAWNFPLNLGLRKLSACLAAGCTAVVKPPEDTPLSTLALAILAKEAGIPNGVINVVTAKEPQAVCAEILANPVVKKITFTGSTPVGKILMHQAADTVKKLTLELGGNAPGIIFADADLAAVIPAIVAFKLANAGQICTNINRLMVQDSIYDEVIKRIQIEMDKVVIGNGLDKNTTMGPVVNIRSVERIKGLMEDALQKGATILRGGKPHPLGHAFFEPTLLINATADMRIANEEIFGPVIAVYRFKTEDEILEFSNATHYGLASYLYTKDYARILRFTENLEYGIVAVNTTDYSYEGVPFGGTKESGIGREGGAMGVDEFLEIKTICIKA